jgi:formylglycine-generating enzyme required for sulfatase activity
MRAAALIVVAVILVASVAACRAPASLPEEGHVVVYLDTDTPVPVLGEVATPDRPMPLFDTVSIEIVDTSGKLACDACAREFSLDEARLADGATFTVLAAIAARDVRVHATARRAENAPGAPQLEVFARVPPAPAEGAREVTLMLPLAALDGPVGTLAAPAALRDGTPPRPRALARETERRSCTRASPAKTACVPGGAYWMGTSGEAFSFILEPRVVSLRPFFIDVHEVTVAELRAWGPKDGIVAQSGSLDGSSPADFCTFTSSAGRFDDYPVNCIDWETARAYCRSRNGDLPTEAQFSYVASGTQSWPYPWGRDRPGCADVVMGRGPRSELWPDTPAGAFGRQCLPDASPGGDPMLDAIGFPKPTTRASYGFDVLKLPSGDVRDLVGNLAEWTRDRYEDRFGTCWHDKKWQRDPSCPGDGDRPLHGSSWTSTTVDGAIASWRQGLSAKPEKAGISVGFRCVYEGD